MMIYNRLLNLTYILFVLLNTTTYAQDIVPVTTVDSKNIRVSKKQELLFHSINDKPMNGYYHIIINQGRDYGKQHFKDGFLHGRSEIFINNKLKKLIDYCNGIFCGTYDKYHTNGNIAIKSHYNNAGQRHGDYQQFQQVDGRLVLKRHYQQGLIEGIETRYFKDGDNGVEIETSYIKGLKNGTQKHHKRLSKHPSIKHYKNDILHGDDISYYSNGQIQTKTTYVDGIQKGLTQYFDEQGQLIEEY